MYGQNSVGLKVVGQIDFGQNDIGPKNVIGRIELHPAPPPTNDFGDSSYRYDTPKFRFIFEKRCGIGLYRLHITIWQPKIVIKKITGGS